MFRSLLMILSGNVANAIFGMIRNILIARMISLEDFGIASTFMLAMALIDMVSALGLQQQMVQAKNGGDPHMQAALQGFQALRGVMNGVLLFVLAGWIAAFFGQPETAWAYQLLALVPMLGGFLHFDVQRMSRQMNYGPALMILALPPLVSVMVLPVLFVLSEGYAIMLWALLAQALAATIVSHLIAKRPYRLVLDRAIMRESLHFGWPLLVNGLLMFLIFNGERMIVGRELGMAALALFGMAFTLSLSPTMVMAKSALNFFLPQLSAAKEEQAFHHLSLTTFEAHFLLGNFLLVSIALLGGPFIHFALGERYADAIPLLTWVAIMQAVRLMKGGSSTVALARAQTRNAMIANLMRVGLLPLAWWVAATGGDLRMVIWIGIAGEFIGLIVGLVLVLWPLRLPKRPLILPILSSMAVLVAGGFHAAGQHDAMDWVPDPATGGIVLALFVISLFTMRNLVLYVRRRQVMRHVD